MKQQDKLLLTTGKTIADAEILLENLNVLSKELAEKQKKAQVYYKIVQDDDIWELVGYKPSQVFIVIPVYVRRHNDEKSLCNGICDKINSILKTLND